MNNAPRCHYATVTSKYYLLKLLAQLSRLEELEERPFTYHVLCMDTLVRRVLEALHLDNLRLYDLESWESDALKEVKTGRTLAEYCWTVKPPFLLHLMEDDSAVGGITFLDSDLYPFAPLDSVWRQLDDASILLYPHRFPQEFAALDQASGRYNGGMISFKNNPAGREAARWWTDRVIEWCFHRDDNGRLGDQKYLLSFHRRFEGVTECRDPGVNVGPWSITGYRVTVEQDKVLIDGRALTLYHFHQFALQDDFSFVPAAAMYPLDDVVITHIYTPYRDRLKRIFARITEIIPGFDIW